MTVTPLSTARRRLSVRPAALAGAAIVLLGLALRLYRLGAQSLWLDEGGTWAEVTRRSWGALLADLISPDAAYPLYHLLLKGWVALAGDTEWALRLPSALAGAALVLVVYLAARECVSGTNPLRRGALEWNHEGPKGHEVTQPSTHLLHALRALRGYLINAYPTLAALLAATAPFALTHAQDAKVYSLLLLGAALLLWALLRALRLGRPRDWLALLGLAFVSLFVHRLALLAVVSAMLVLVAAWPYGKNQELRTKNQEPRTKNRLPHPGSRLSVLGSRFFSRYGRWLLLGAALAGAALAISGLAQAVGTEQRGGSGHVPAGPLLGMWLALAHFALDHGNISGWLGLPLLAWMLPALALTLWGAAGLARAARHGDQAALAVLGMVALPLLLFAAALSFARLFEARYVLVAFPAWLLVAAYPLRAAQDTKHETQDANLRNLWIFPLLPRMLYAAALLVHAAVLFQPQHGQFSGAPVKEQWREGMAALAARAHPDDLLILHPYYVQALWDYYAPRVTPDPLPQPVRFDLLGQGYCRDIAQSNATALAECYRRSYEEAFNRAAQGRKRMLMLIAPAHARTIDPPKSLAELRAEAQAQGRPAPDQPDKYGFLGLRFQHADTNGTWPCGGAGFVGVELMCASFPSFYLRKGPESIPQPATPLVATFGGEIELRGYTLAPLGGQLRPGGTLPITLYWQALVPPSRNYALFLHLCRDCSAPPPANDDAPPLLGYPPAGYTSTWQPADPVHDERSIRLPADLAPGRYTLLLGAYPADDSTEAARLAVQSDAPVIGGNRLVLGEVQVGAVR